MAIGWIDDDLDKWGRYMGGRDSGMGFPTCSPEARAGEGTASKQVADGFVPIDVARMERAVLAMGKKDSDLSAVVKEFYMTGHTREVQAKRLSAKLDRNISRRTLCELVDRAHYFIDGYLINAE